MRVSCGFINGPINYNPILNTYTKEDILVMYIPYQDIQYYNNALLFEAENPLDVIKSEVLNEAVSKASDAISDVIESVLGVGRQFSFLLTVLGVADKYRKALIKKAQNKMHKAAQQSATDKKTGMIVVIKKKSIWKWVMDVTNVRGGYYLGPTVTHDIKYYEATDYFKK